MDSTLNDTYLIGTVFTLVIISKLVSFMDTYNFCLAHSSLWQILSKVCPKTYLDLKLN